MILMIIPKKQGYVSSTASTASWFRVDQSSLITISASSTYLQAMVDRISWWERNRGNNNENLLSMGTFLSRQTAFTSMGWESNFCPSKFMHWSPHCVCTGCCTRRHRLGSHHRILPLWSASRLHSCRNPPRKSTSHSHPSCTWTLHQSSTLNIPPIAFPSSHSSGV